MPPRINGRVMARVILAGSAWGVTLSSGFLIVAASRCGMPCPYDIAMGTMACIGTGILTIGPLAIFPEIAATRSSKRSARQIKPGTGFKQKATGSPVAFQRSRFCFQRSLIRR